MVHTSPKRGKKGMKAMHWLKTKISPIKWTILFPEIPSLMPLSFGREVLDEGEFAQLVCIVSKGDEPITITWALKGDTISSEPGLSTTTLGTRTGMLTIQSVGFRHAGEYTCSAKNAAGSASQTASLKVNGKIGEKRGRESDRHCF
jgi:hypothetical protein